MFCQPHSREMREFPSLREHRQGRAWLGKRAATVRLHLRKWRAFQATLAPGDAREDWETLASLLSAVEKTFETPSSVDGVIKALASEIPAFEGQSFGSIGDLGVQITETGVTIPLLEQEKARVESGLING